MGGPAGGQAGGATGGPAAVSAAERAERGHSYSSDASSCCSDGVHCGTPPLNDGEDSNDRLCADGLHCEEDLAPSAWSHRLSEVVEEEPASPPPPRALINRRSSAPIVLAIVSSSSSSSSSSSNASSRRQGSDVRRGSLPVDVHLMAAQILSKGQVAAIPEVPPGPAGSAGIGGSAAHLVATSSGLHGPPRRGSCPVALSTAAAKFHSE